MTTSDKKSTANNHAIDQAYGGFKFRIFMSETGATTADDKSWSNTGINQAFTKISGVASESEVIEYMQGTDSSVGTSQGRVKYANITMERVYKGLDDLYKWRRRIERGTYDRRSLKIEMLTLDDFLIRSMILYGAWPCKWNMPDLDAGDSSPAIETIELAVIEVYEE